MYVAALILLAVLLAWPVPRLLPRVTALRAAPAAATLLWQCVSLAAIAAGLLAAPLAVLIQARATSGRHDPEPGQHLPLLVAGLAVTAFVAGRLLLKAHLVGTDLRRGRKEHTELVDLIGVDDAVLGEHVKVLTHPTPTAYCVPGSRKRVVLTRAPSTRSTPTNSRPSSPTNARTCGSGTTWCSSSSPCCTPPCPPGSAAPPAWAR